MEKYSSDFLVAFTTHPRCGADSAQLCPLQGRHGRLRHHKGFLAATKAFEEAVAAKKAERYASFKGPKPFHFQTDKRVERKQPLLYMDVNLGAAECSKMRIRNGRTRHR